MGLYTPMIFRVSTEIKCTPPPPTDHICPSWTHEGRSAQAHEATKASIQGVQDRASGLCSLPRSSTVVNSGLLLTWLTTVNDGPLTMQGVNDGNVTVNDGLVKVNDGKG